MDCFRSQSELMRFVRFRFFSQSSNYQDENTKWKHHKWLLLTNADFGIPQLTDLSFFTIQLYWVTILFAVLHQTTHVQSPHIRRTNIELFDFPCWTIDWILHLVRFQIAIYIIYLHIEFAQRTAIRPFRSHQTWVVVRHLHRTNVVRHVNVRWKFRYCEPQKAMRRYSKIFGGQRMWILSK